MNIIVHTPERVCYTTTAFIGRKEAVNNLTVAKAVMEAWGQVGLPRDHVGVVLVDNAGYYAKAFKDHLAALLATHSCTRAGLILLIGANRFGAAMLEHTELAHMHDYMRRMRSMLWGAQQAQCRQRYIDFMGESPPDYIRTNHRFGLFRESIIQPFSKCLQVNDRFSAGPEGFKIWSFSSWVHVHHRCWTILEGGGGSLSMCTHVCTINFAQSVGVQKPVIPKFPAWPSILDCGGGVTWYSWWHLVNSKDDSFTLLFISILQVPTRHGTHVNAEIPIYNNISTRV